ncbi:hypothetical protein CRG98_001858 [Punica granatum]|nr:hypothetical protein CRG98_001858 [Punica granatum]
MWIRNRGCPGANVDRGCPGLHLWKWPIAGALCDVSDHLLLFFAVRASWRAYAAEVTSCSKKTVASMLNDLLDYSHLRLRRGVPYRWTPLSSKYKERVRDKFSGKRELVHRPSPVVNVPL